MSQGVTAKVLSPIIGWSVSKIRLHAERGLIPCTKTGSQTRFNVKDVQLSIAAKEPAKGYKVCRKCKEELPIDEFYKIRYGNGSKGRHSYCKGCNSDLSTKRYRRIKKAKAMQKAIGK